MAGLTGSGGAVANLGVAGTPVTNSPIQIGFFSVADFSISGSIYTYELTGNGYKRTTIKFGSVPDPQTFALTYSNTSGYVSSFPTADWPAIYAIGLFADNPSVPTLNFVNPLLISVTLINPILVQKGRTLYIPPGKLIFTMSS